MPRGISQICRTEPQKTDEYTRRSKVKSAICFAGRKLHSKVQHHKYNPSCMCLMHIMHARVQLLTACIKLFTQTPKESSIQSKEKTSGRSWERGRRLEWIRATQLLPIALFSPFPFFTVSLISARVFSLCRCFALLFGTQCVLRAVRCEWSNTSI